MRELTQKQLWLLRMIFEEGIENEVSRYGKDNPRSSRGRVKRQITDEEVTGDKEITAEPAIIQRVHEGGDEQLLLSRRTKGKSGPN